MPEEALDSQSECILVSAMVHLPQEWNLHLVNSGEEYFIYGKT